MYREIWRPAGDLQVVRVCVDRAAVFGPRLANWAAVSTRYGGRGIQTTRSSANSSDDVVKTSPRV